MSDGFWTKNADGTQTYRYTLKVTDDGFETLHWLAARGYDCGLEAALERTETEGVYAIRESKAWEIQEASECLDSGFACLSWESAIGQEIRRFLDSIV